MTDSNAAIAEGPPVTRAPTSTTPHVAAAVTPSAQFAPERTSAIVSTRLTTMVSAASGTADHSRSPVR